MREATLLKNALVSLLVLCLLAFAVPATAYSDRSFRVSAAIDENGNAHVTETISFYLGTQAEVQAFEYMQGTSSQNLADWTKFSKNVKYHFNSVDSTSLKIVPTREFSSGYNVASLTLEYDAIGVFLLNKTSTRTTRYLLDKRQLALNLAGEKSGQISLEKNTAFELVLPKDAFGIWTLPSAGVSRNGVALSWTGPIAGSWDVSFDREKALSAEVSEFFAQTYEQLSTSGALLIFAVLLIAAVLFKLFASRQ